MKRFYVALLYTFFIAVSVTSIYMVLNVNEHTLKQAPVYQDF